jgi:hypothetical protein
MEEISGDRYQDEAEGEKHYKREDHKYAEERKGTNRKVEDSRGKKRLNAEKVDSGDLKGTSANRCEGRRETDKHVPRPGHSKDEHCKVISCIKGSQNLRIC